MATVSGKTWMNSLPVELINIILDKTDIRTLLACRTVCKRFRDCADSPNLQYKAELALAGMQDGPPSDIAPAERLRLLRAHQKAWDSLAWTEEETIPMLEGDTWELIGGVLGLADGPKAIMFRQLQSKLRGIPGGTWKVELNFTLRDFTLDPTQDLIAALEVSESLYIHLRSLSTGEEHSLAANPRFDTLCLPEPGSTYDIRVSGRFIGIIPNPAEDDAVALLVFDWRTGEIVMSLDVDGLQCFAFLPDDLLMFAAVGVDSEPFLAIFDLTSALDSPAHCFLNLPMPGASTQVGEILISSDASHPSLKRPFSLNPEDHLFTITFQTYVWDSDTFSTYLLCLPWSNLRHLVTRDGLSSDGPRIIWDDWGPSNTRFLALSHEIPDVWVCHTYGTKCAVASGPKGRHFSSVRLFDFNQMSTKRDIQSDRNLSNVLVDPTIVDSSVLTFDTRVSTDIPCRYVEVDLPRSADGKYEAVMMSEDSLIAVSMEKKEFTIFTF